MTKDEYYKKKLLDMADQLCELKKAIWRDQQEDEIDKEELTFKLFDIQSDLRNVAELVGCTYFGDEEIFDKRA